MEYKEFADKAHKNAKKKGFWDETLSKDHYQMLIVTEIAEIIEADRKGEHADVEAFHKQAKHRPYIEAFEQCIKNTVEDEMADVAIRLADLAGALEIDYDKVNVLECSWPFKHRTMTETAFILVCALCSVERLESRVLYCLVFLFEWAEHLNIDLWFFIERKMIYNDSRPRLHGKKY